MAFRYKVSFEIVTTERVPEFSRAKEHFESEFAPGTEYKTEDGRAAKILDAKVEATEEIL